MELIAKTRLHASGSSREWTPDLGDPDERELVRRMLAGDERAMEEFADVYFPGVYRFALSRLRGDRELARELVQATVCKALDKLASFRGESPLLGWLCACCRNEIAMYFRRRSASPWMEPPGSEDTGDPVQALPAVEPTPDEALLRSEESRQVHQVLGELPPHYARALEWKYVERLPVAEIASRLGLGLKAAESILSRARQAFREVHGRLATSARPASWAEGGRP